VNCEINFDDCTSNPCVHGICMDGINHYSCVCSPGFTVIPAEGKIAEKPNLMRTVMPNAQCCCRSLMFCILKLGTPRSDGSQQTRKDEAVCLKSSGSYFGATDKHLKESVVEAKEIGRDVTLTLMSVLPIPVARVQHVSMV
ncbi:hypothetical protein P7K49_016212, partial [Saguinus oedipus]